MLPPLTGLLTLGASCKRRETCALFYVLPQSLNQKDFHPMICFYGCFTARLMLINKKHIPVIERQFERLNLKLAFSEINIP